MREAKRNAPGRASTSRWGRTRERRVFFSQMSWTRPMTFAATPTSARRLGDPRIMSGGPPEDVLAQKITSLHGRWSIRLPMFVGLAQGRRIKRTRQVLFVG